MSWAQQRHAIKLAAEAGVRARTTAAGSETLPLTHNHLRYAMLSRPNGELTRAGHAVLLPADRPAAPQPAVRPHPALDPRGALGLHPPAGRREKARPEPPAGRELPPHEAREELLQGQVDGLAGPRAGHHPRRPAQGPERRQRLRADQVPPRHYAERHAVPAERRPPTGEDRGGGRDDDERTTTSAGGEDRGLPVRIGMRIEARGAMTRRGDDDDDDDATTNTRAAL